MVILTYPLNKKEKKCLRAIAKWFNDAHSLIERSKAMSELEFDDKTYNIVMRKMEDIGAIKANSVMSPNNVGFADSFEPLSQADTLLRQAKFNTRNRVWRIIGKILAYLITFILGVAAGLLIPYLKRKFGLGG